MLFFNRLEFFLDLRIFFKGIKNQRRVRFPLKSTSRRDCERHGEKDSSHLLNWCPGIPSQVKNPPLFYNDVEVDGDHYSSPLLIVRPDKILSSSIFQFFNFSPGLTMALTHTHTQPIPRHNRVLPDRVLVRGGGEGRNLSPASLAWGKLAKRRRKVTSSLNMHPRISCEKGSDEEGGSDFIISTTGYVVLDI